MNLATDTKIKFHIHTLKSILSLYMGPLQYKIKRKNERFSVVRLSKTNSSRLN